MKNETSTEKTFWQQVVTLCKSPVSILTDKTKDNPLITILAIVFVLQPIISSGISLVKDTIEVKQTLDPNNRPVTKGELDIVNTKIDFIQQLIVTDMQNDAAAEQAKNNHKHLRSTPSVASTPVNGVSSDAKVDIRSKFSDLNKKLQMVQKTLDSQYKNAKK